MYWDVTGFDGDSRRNIHELVSADIGGENSFPDHKCPEPGEFLRNYFFELRKFTQSNDDLITPSIVRQWSEFCGVWLCRREEAIIYQMDRAFRSSMGDCMAYHEGRRRKKAEMDRAR